MSNAFSVQKRGGCLIWTAVVENLPHEIRSISEMSSRA